MTAQVMETLVHKGNKLFMAAEPLRSYLYEQRPDVKFLAPHTACWRGYTGTWEIVKGKFFLTGLDSYGPSIEEIFDVPMPVFAEWFTGEIRVVVGELLLYVHMGYGSLYEKELYIEIERGIVITEEEIDNREAFEKLSEVERYKLMQHRKYRS